MTTTDVQKGEANTAVVRRQNYDLQATGLLVQGELSFEDWSGIGAWLEAAEQGIQWWIGDWMVYGESRYGDQYVQALESTGWAIATIRQYQWVCEKVPRQNRRSDLSFFHHRAVAELDAKDQAAWLKKAAEGDAGDTWTVDRLRREIKQSKKGTSDTIWVLVAATDGEDAQALVDRFKAEGREAKLK